MNRKDVRRLNGLPMPTHTIPITPARHGIAKSRSASLTCSQKYSRMIGRGARRLAVACVLSAATFAHAGDIDPNNPPQGRFSDQWFEVYMGGRKVGYGHSTLARNKDRVQTASSFMMRIDRADQPVEMEMKQWTTETLTGAPISFGMDMEVSVMKTMMEGKVEGGRVTIVNSQYGMKQKQTYDYPKEALMAWGLFRESLLRGFVPGTRYTTKVYAPELRLDGPVQAATVVGEWETFMYRGQAKRGQKVTVTLTSPIGSMEMVSWVDGDGLPLKARLPMPGLGDMEMIAVDEATALGDFVPPEMFLTSTIKANRRINPKSARRIKYRLRAKEQGLGAKIDLAELPETDMQAVTQRPDGSIEVVVTRQSHSHRPAGANKTARREARPPLAEYLEANLMINTADPTLIELAKRARAGEKDPYKLADRLRRFVSDYVRTKSLSVGFATASEVARTRQGDCSEHGVLLAALGRLNGLPSRVAVGLAYVPVFGRGNDNDIFGYHLWTQFFIDGRWVDVDAALGETLCSPTRIAFATSSLKNSGLADLSLPLLTMIGAIEVDIVEIAEIESAAD